MHAAGGSGFSDSGQCRGASLFEMDDGENFQGETRRHGIQHRIQSLSKLPNDLPRPPIRSAFRHAVIALAAGCSVSSRTSRWRKVDGHKQLSFLMAWPCGQIRLPMVCKSTLAAIEPCKKADVCVIFAGLANPQPTGEGYAGRHAGPGNAGHNGIWHCCHQDSKDRYERQQQDPLADC